ncbi:LemA family protein [Mycoplasma mycoides]|uniref:LemA family protein n=1 Tax=Mycoplasma mycoides TaxID=2102 RepID=UPI002732AECF|nr:LemA family protein [Mycoplasma mycoides]MDP4040685.1 LemA family protein [Mycoplasma mycoides]MDP4041580.1 LemA family protein [Mycoplasma mycoides]MDP4042446.1 LemA family protein [Mycoplasma mycoides]MDP4043920.1 LemA family protein [Mycoplasma mycoides]MDP4044826.1 LemA family protein [Mycoplasma mycoides]
MANQLDEMNDPILEQGRQVNVINKQIPITVGKGSLVFEILLWVLGIIPGIIFTFIKIKAKNHLAQLEQKVQHNASQIDNYLDQRAVVMQNLASLLSKSIELDKDVIKTVAAYRSGINVNDENRSDVASQLDTTIRGLHLQIENYPDLKAHESIKQALQQNLYLQKEITAARDIYNDTVFQWNRSINEWPAKMIVAAKMHYTTRIPFAASAETKKLASQDFFK